MTDKNADSNYDLNKFCCKIWDIYNTCLESSEFDRFRVLCAEGENDEATKKREEKEKKDFQEKIENLLSEYCGHFFEYTKENGIWVIINYYSLFLNTRLNALKSSADDFCKEVKSGISWYNLFGSLNKDAVFLLTKADTKNALQNSEIKTLHIPKSCHNGFSVSDEGKLMYTLDNNASSAIKTFQDKLHTTIKEISEEREFLKNKNFAEIDAEDIAATLFKEYNMKHWKECLIFSSKYKVEFGESLKYFPNILFFKKKGVFTRDDIRLCNRLNEYYVKLVSRLLIFENEILLDRLDDLVATKTQRLFKTFKKKTSKEKYKQSVKDLIHSFFDGYVNEIHPTFKEDIVLAYWLYWTRYFSSDSLQKNFLRKNTSNDEPDVGGYLSIDSYSVEYKDEIKKWEDIYPQKAKEINFDVKELVFEFKGEKSPIEFKRMETEEFSKFVQQPEGTDIQEFIEIVIGNYDELSPTCKKKYISYLKKALHKIRSEFFTESHRNLIKDIDNNLAKEAAKYLSLFCQGGISKTPYRYIYYIPSLTHDGNSFGGFSLFCKNKWPRTVTKVFQRCATRFGTAFSEIERVLSVKEHALRAAIAAIMGRNMSHNLGSNAIWYLAQNLADNKEVINDPLEKLNKVLTVLKKTKRNGLQSKDGLKQIEDTLSAHESSLKQQVENVLFYNTKTQDFLDYVRERMGFVGLVSTTQPSWTSSERLEKVIERFNEGTVKEHIVKSEIDNKQYTIKYINHVNDKDVLIDFPHASYGHQAFYLILENIIRNSIKHNINNLPDGTIEFFIELSESENEEVKHDFYRISITDNIKCCNMKLVRELTDHIDDDIIKKDASLNNRYLGMKEQKIAAAFLRMEKTKVLLPGGAKQLNPPLLRIHCCEKESDCKCFSAEQHNCTNEGNLVFEFYLKKPKECLIVSGRCELKNKRGDLSVHGIDVCNNVKELVQWKVPHKFIIFDLCKDSGIQQDEVIEHIKKYRLELPYRIGFITDNDLSFDESNEAWEQKIFSVTQTIIDNVINSDTNGCDNFIRTLWETWLPKIRKNLPQLYFLDNRNEPLSRGRYIVDIVDSINDSIIFRHDPVVINRNNFFYYDEYSGPIQELDSYKSENLLYEACLYKVAVVDERVNREKQKDISLPQGSEDELNQIWKMRRLKLIDHHPIIREMDFSEVTSYKPHILIIHLGVIEKTRRNYETKFDSMWNKMRGEIPWIVIDSDRGRSDEIKKYGGRWLHFSDLGRPIINDVEKCTSKLNLINIITSLREK